MALPQLFFPGKVLIPQDLLSIHLSILKQTGTINLLNEHVIYILLTEIFLNRPLLTSTTTSGTSNNTAATTTTTTTSTATTAAADTTTSSTTTTTTSTTTSAANKEIAWSKKIVSTNKKSVWLEKESG